MNDNLPEINFKEKKEKKRGALGWLKSRLGVGSRGAMGEAGINPSVMNVGKAALGGGAKFGASTGIAGLLAGKAGLIATVAALAVGTGVYLANQAPSPSGGNSAFNSGKVKQQSEYVPAILRSQAANQGSSLDMFKESNQNTGLSMEEDLSKKPAKPAAENPAPAQEEAAQEQPAPGQGEMSQDMMGKLQGASIGSLTSSLGGGSNKFSAMGGFGNKFNQGQTGGKTGFSNNIGSGFQAMPKFESRKAKLGAMNASARPVFTKGSAGKKGKFGTGAFAQVKGMKKVQQSYKGKNADTLAATQNEAWNGSTPDGSATGGTGVSDGGAGIMSSPSLDNAGGSNGGGGGSSADEPVVPEASGPTDVSPWASAVSMAMMLIMMSCMMTALGAYLIKLSYGAAAAVGVAGGWLRIAGMALCAIAALMAGYAIYQAITIMGQHGQALLGTVYLVGGAAAAAAAIIAMASGTYSEIPPSVMVLAAAAGIITMIGSMLGSK